MRCRLGRCAHGQRNDARGFLSICTLLTDIHAKYRGGFRPGALGSCCLAQRAERQKRQHDGQKSLSCRDDQARSKDCHFQWARIISRLLVCNYGGGPRLPENGSCPAFLPCCIPGVPFSFPPTLSSLPSAQNPRGTLQVLSRNQFAGVGQSGLLRMQR